MSGTTNLLTQTSENARRVPLTNDKICELQFDAEPWRFSWLMDTADLSLIKRDHFQLICRVLRTSVFSNVVDGRRFLIDAIADATERHNLFRENIADKRFVNETFACGRYFFNTLEAERYLLEEVAAALVKLDATAGLALVIRAEQVSIATDDDFETCCGEMYSTIQSLRHLYADKNPSRGHR